MNIWGAIGDGLVADGDFHKSPGGERSVSSLSFTLESNQGRDLPQIVRERLFCRKSY